jgi:hypothetical protein
MASGVLLVAAAQVRAVGVLGSGWRPSPVVEQLTESHAE